ncbi:MAG: hypothetical protein NXY57DRAFT_1023695 [Lentinula lateritia]|uniref:Uncharacterized protein n=2 Tax=Lentinula TaxID=5352 RepID=A0ACC1TTX9_9AGAR|nr:hypothetical protein F5876DRAFT_67500 [Lentinula aff. lateritia]KAJ3927863.1 MAG: hypothetical protein NXY57DRAFT_1023695 [Lentinula lateritia]KAJ4464489.1 hypothetical protein C8R41DRAFT_859948 [Lentinula lateritia]
MGFFHHESDEAQAYDQVVNAPHKAELSHELIAAAASYEAAKAYEKHCAENGKPDNHAKAKELLAAFSGAFVDRMVETKGLDFVDKEKAKHQAKKQAEEGLQNNTEWAY